MVPESCKKIKIPEGPQNIYGTYRLLTFCEVSAKPESLELPETLIKPVPHLTLLRTVKASLRIPYRACRFIDISEKDV